MFRYDPAIIDRFPAVRAGVILATGLTSGPASDDLAARFAAQQAETRAALAARPVAEWPSVAAWRRVFSAFGTKPTQYRNAAESLLRRLDKQGDVPSLGALVDAGNLVAIRYGLPVAVFDLDRVAAPVTVRFAAGDEPWADLGASETTHPDAGEVVFTDADGQVHARRWCWRQSATSAAYPGTTRALFTIEGHHDGAEGDVAAALADLEALLRETQPAASLRTDELSAARPATAFD